MILPGQVRKVSVAVMVDGIVSKLLLTAKDAWAPRPAEEMATLRQLVQSAVGFDAARGDTVTHRVPAIHPAGEHGSLAARAGSGFFAMYGPRLAQLGVLGAIVLALIFFVLRPMTQPPAAAASSPN